MPDHVPDVALSTCATCAVPLTTGAPVEAGATPLMTCVVGENDSVLPALFVAVTRIRRNFPMSSSTGT